MLCIGADIYLFIGVADIIYLSAERLSPIDQMRLDGCDGLTDVDFVYCHICLCRFVHVDY